MINTHGPLAPNVNLGRVYINRKKGRKSLQVFEMVLKLS